MDIGMSNLEELSKQYSVILKTLLEHGDSSITPQINQIKSILDVLKIMPSDESEDIIIEKVRKMNDFLYPPRGGLAEFYIWSDDFDERIKLNEPLDIAKQTTWNILNHSS
ncbi:hypothetical protein [Sporosarcina sp. NPDC096371]|uniref:hypothetical protein n=1 Tax=Sporosarcina sp. NPDC096371 TaxID=3364530 RepID=UPI003814C377